MTCTSYTSTVLLAPLASSALLVCYSLGGMYRDTEFSRALAGATARARARAGPGARAMGRGLG